MKRKYVNFRGRDEILICRHHKSFPPPQMHPQVVEERGDEEEQRKNKQIDDAVYQRIKVWKKVCNQHQLGDKCITCEHLCIETSYPGQKTYLNPFPKKFRTLKKLP